ncbi:SWIM zinc finger domain-containing protein [Herpetosiphon sp. NSE202]|uniref:SWIM zinc finger family protein n=1 Tax=Herpetosiphon sp. NSE202 TaxID=3351349 RepID=UPI0036312141
MEFPVVSEAQIQAIAGVVNFEQGLEYFEQGMVEAVQAHGASVQASVVDRNNRHYLVSIQTHSAQQITIQCTCVAQASECCAHGVAVLLFLSYCSDQVLPEATTSKVTLDELEAGQLRTLLRDVAEQHPEVSSLVDDRIERLGF